MYAQGQSVIIVCLRYRCDAVFVDPFEPTQVSIIHVSRIGSRKRFNSNTSFCLRFWLYMIMRKNPSTRVQKTSLSSRHIHSFGSGSVPCCVHLFTFISPLFRFASTWAYRRFQHCVSRCIQMLSGPRLGLRKATRAPHPMPNSYCRKSCYFRCPIQSSNSRIWGIKASKW